MCAAILWVCAVIAIAVFGMMIYSVATFPTSPSATPATYRHSTLIEIVWTLIPIAILVGAAWPAVKLIQSQEVALTEAAP